MAQKAGEKTKLEGIAALDNNGLFLSVFRHIQTGIVIIDPEHHTIIDANPIAEALIGERREELIGHVCHGFICPAQHGACPVTDLKTNLENTERTIVNKKGERVSILKTVAILPFQGKNYLVESFVDITDRKNAEDRRIALLGYMNESVLRVRHPLELTYSNLRQIADQVRLGEFDHEDTGMELRIQANNLEQIAKNLKDLADAVVEEHQDIPEEYRRFLSGS
jgi:PAS domain S-box-containing protein